MSTLRFLDRENFAAKPREEQVRNIEHTVRALGFLTFSYTGFVPEGLVEGFTAVLRQGCQT